MFKKNQTYNIEVIIFIPIEDKHSDKSCLNPLFHAMSFVKYLKFIENRNSL